MTQEQDLDKPLTGPELRLVGLTQSVHIETTYMSYCSTTVELPEGVIWDDIVSYYVKWDELHFTTQTGPGAVWSTILLNSDYHDINMKRPQNVSVYLYDTETEEPDYDHILSESN